MKNRTKLITVICSMILLVGVLTSVSQRIYGIHMGRISEIEKIPVFFEEQMEQNIKEKEYETIKTVCNVVVREVNDDFKIEMNSSFANALTGGMNDYLNGL